MAGWKFWKRKGDGDASDDGDDGDDRASSRISVRPRGERPTIPAMSAVKQTSPGERATIASAPAVKPVGHAQDAAAPREPGQALPGGASPAGVTASAQRTALVSPRQLMEQFKQLQRLKAEAVQGEGPEDAVEAVAGPAAPAASAEALEALTPVDAVEAVSAAEAVAEETDEVSGPSVEAPEALTPVRLLPVVELPTPAEPRASVEPPTPAEAWETSGSGMILVEIEDPEAPEDSEAMFDVAAFEALNVGWESVIELDEEAPVVPHAEVFMPEEALESAPLDQEEPDVAPLDQEEPDVAPLEPAPLEPALLDLDEPGVAPLEPAPLEPAPLDQGAPDVAPLEPAPLDQGAPDVAPLDLESLEPAPIEPAPLDQEPLDRDPMDQELRGPGSGVRRLREGSRPAPAACGVLSRPQARRRTPTADPQRSVTLRGERSLGRPSGSLLRDGGARGEVDGARRVAGGREARGVAGGRDDGRVEAYARLCARMAQPEVAHDAALRTQREQLRRVLLDSAVERLGPLSACPQARRQMSSLVGAVELDPQQAYLLSLIDGQTSLEALLEVAGMSEPEAALALLLLARRRLVRW